MKPNRKPVFLCEAETTVGLEFVTEAELRRVGAEIGAIRPGEIDFRFSGELDQLLALKTVQSVSLVQSFNVPRPRGLLDNTNIWLLVQQIDLIRKLSPSSAYQSYFIAAAGSDSAIMNRIKTALTQHTGLVNGNEKGDLWIRIRPNRVGGWETVIRLSPRPLVTRAWRVCNLEGALNAATAHAMVLLTKPEPDDTFVNLACGSATLLIERLEYGACHRTLGIDFAASHLLCAQQNIRASRAKKISLQLADIAYIPLPIASVTALCADLPFGQLTGSHTTNQKLYPAVLDEAARVAVVGARFVLLTHEIRLMEESLLPQHSRWALEQTIRINLRGLHPRIYVLRRQ